MMIFFVVIALASLGLPKTFPVSSAYYKVDPSVAWAAEPGFLKFHVTARHGVYDVEGLVPLRKLLHEVEVIERIRQENGGTGFMDGAVDSVEATGEGFVKLVSHPIESGKGIGKAAGKLGGKIGGVFRKKEEGEKTSFGEKVLGGSRREIAKEFQVDVYTSNPHLDRLLTGMAKARLGGKGAAFVGKLLLPVAALVSATLTVSGINSAADQLVNDRSRVDLYQLNKEALGILGFSQREIKDFLNSRFYTPREATYIRFYLERLKGIKGHREIFRTALKAKSRWDAAKILYTAQIAADASADKKARFQQIQSFPEGLAVCDNCSAAADGARLLFITPYDYLDRSPLAEKVLARADAVKGQWSTRSAEIWNGGKVTLEFSTHALMRGIKTKGWFLLQQQGQEI